MAHAAAQRAEKFLQRECADPHLRVKWDDSIERFVVGRFVPSFSKIEWFYVSTDGDSGFRPIDQRTVRKVLSLDTWRREKTLSMNDFIDHIERGKQSDKEKNREIIKYRLKHESRYIKKAAVKDGII
jgi:hypothetical protein